jgi:hypothetical protein
LPNAPPRTAPDLTLALDDTDPDDLPHALETVTRLGLKELRRILRLPLKETNAGLLRAKVTAALGAINAQLRADEARLRTKATGDVLERLSRLIDEQRKLIPKQDLAASEPIEQAAVEPTEA